MNDNPQQPGLWGFMDSSDEPECEPGDQEDYTDILARSTQEYDPRFDYAGGPKWADPCQRKRWFALRNRLAQAQDWTCYYCGVVVSHGYIHIDHKQPASRDGSHHILNLCVTCPTCNLSKGDRTEEEFCPSKTWKEKHIPSDPAQYDKRFKTSRLVSVSSLESKQDTDKYRSGRRVRHAKFGDGIIVRATAHGNDIEVEVVFEMGGIKRLAASIARLEFLEEQ